MKEFERVHPRAKTKWRLTRIIGFVFLAIIAAIVYFAAGEEGRLYALIIGGAVLLLQLINIIVYPIIEYIQWSYLVDEDRIEIKKGIFWRSHTIIPITRIQHVSASSGPVQRLFGLASVQIHTAGGNFTIEELSKDVAGKICDSLRTVINIKVLEKRAADMIAGTRMKGAEE